MNDLLKKEEFGKTYLFLVEIEKHNQHRTPIKNINLLAQSHELDKTKPKTLIDSGFIVKKEDGYSVAKPINPETVLSFLRLQSAKKRFLKEFNSFKKL